MLTGIECEMGWMGFDRDDSGDVLFLGEIGRVVNLLFRE